ncbi:complex I intermediate-associated protein 30-domain-containing protein [Podospora aff. communis PSN243]|uniref:Complex I intermediate-associated protein 30-domain-containing protein n=1 Tax=Podospora aff. communis PSN243 TaxID=3040156 RepID=A0AAV9GBF7_9PEZI|nr:complex I intermediate-associated protein 30-domain-containing protein [Podospora aff. communis PSN243]
MVRPGRRISAGSQATDSRSLDIFGGCDPMRRRAWILSGFAAQTDQARGGKSTCRFDQEDDPTSVIFTGSLDPNSLDPPAAFAAMRTVESWTCPEDLSGYDAFIVDVKSSDRKQYTLVVKDTPLVRRPDGRVASTVSWEHDFRCDIANGSGRIILHFTGFKPFFRGRPIEDDRQPELKWNNVKSISIMCRSHFGNQEGEFTMQLYSISAYRYRDSSPEPSKGGSGKPSSRRKRSIQRLRRFFGGSSQWKSASKAASK